MADYISRHTGEEIDEAIEQVSSKLNKTGDIMTGSLAINPGGLIFTNDNSNGNAQIYKNNSATADYGTVIEDIAGNGAQTTLVISAIDGVNIKNTTEGTSNTYKVLHEGTAEAKKLDYTNIAYAICSTDATTAAKVATIVDNDNWELKTGSIVVVKFSATNTAQNPTLNVNETGAKSIWYNTGLITTNYLNAAGSGNAYITYMYDGTQFVYLSKGYDNNATYTNQSLGNGYGTCATAAATAAKVVTLSGYSLVTNGIVSVKFTYAVPASATMNINSKGAKAIYHKGAAIKAGVINAGDIATFIYNGTQYHLLTTDSASTRPVTMSTTDLTAGTSALATGSIYFVYE